MKDFAGFNPQPPRPPWGIRPPPRKSQSMTRPILVAPAPSRVVIPVRQCLGHPAEPLVRVGQDMLAGEPVARAITDGRAPNVHASISGRVTAITEHAVPGARELCVCIDSDGRDARYTAYENLGDPVSETPADEEHNTTS